MIFGHPPETASMNFEGSRSMVWVMVSLTAVPLGSSSIVHSEGQTCMSSKPGPVGASVDCFDGSAEDVAGAALGDDVLWPRRVGLNLAAQT
jgi:hypothetical protein